MIERLLSAARGVRDSTEEGARRSSTRGPGRQLVPTPPAVSDSVAGPEALQGLRSRDRIADGDRQPARSAVVNRATWTTE